MSTSEESINNLSPELQHSYQRMIEEIYQLTMKAYDLTEFYHSIVNGIQKDSDYYSVNLYIVDSDGKYTILKAGTSELSQAAMQRAHKLAIDAVSLISRVVNTRSVCIGQIKFEDPPIPYSVIDQLPVHSELCAPIISRQDSVIGVLDIQSSEYEAFQKDDAVMFEILANYIANRLEETNKY